MTTLLQRDTLAMTRCTRLLHHVLQLAGTLLTLLGDAVRFLRLCVRSPAALAAENLFLRKQLALYQERHSKPRRATNATRLVLVWLGRWAAGESSCNPCETLVDFPDNCLDREDKIIADDSSSGQGVRLALSGGTTTLSPCTPACPSHAHGRCAV